MHNWHMDVVCAAGARARVHHTNRASHRGNNHTPHRNGIINISIWAAQCTLPCVTLCKSRCLCSMLAECNANAVCVSLPSTPAALRAIGNTNQCNNNNNNHQSHWFMVFVEHENCIRRATIANHRQQKKKKKHPQSSQRHTLHRVPGNGSPQNNKQSICTLIYLHFDRIKWTGRRWPQTTCDILISFDRRELKVANRFWVDISTSSSSLTLAVLAIRAESHQRLAHVRELALAVQTYKSQIHIYYNNIHCWWYANANNRTKQIPFRKYRFA